MVNATLGAHESKLLLARAFDTAWSRYYRPGRVTIASEQARPALAKHLVEMMRAGLTDESQLSASGVLHLISLTPNESDHSSA